MRHEVHYRFVQTRLHYFSGQNPRGLISRHRPQFRFYSNPRLLRGNAQKVFPKDLRL